MLYIDAMGIKYQLKHLNLGQKKVKRHARLMISHNIINISPCVRGDWLNISFSYSEILTLFNSNNRHVNICISISKATPFPFTIQDLSCHKFEIS